MKYLIWMVETAEFPKAAIPRLLEQFGSAKAVFEASEAAIAACVTLKEKQRNAVAAKDLTRAEEILASCKRQNIQVLGILDEKYPQRLKNIYDPPAVLYIRGNLPDFNRLPAIALVGQRKVTPYGKMAADHLGYHLSKRGVIVVSGMAEGTDGAAHTGALKGRTPTVAVFGTAIDQCYPSFHGGLLREILRHGAAISEYPPGKRGYASFFPQRNRIISGLCLGTVVVEAPKKSGSLITAARALDQGRDVFAVPANFDSASSEGCNALIQSGAKLIRGVDDILEEYQGLYDFKPEEKPVRQPKGGSKEKEAAAPPASPQAQTLEQVFAPKAKQREPREDGSEHAALLEAIRGVTSLEEILSRTGLQMHEALAQLTMLELMGKVRQLPGKQFEKTGL